MEAIIVGLILIAVILVLINVFQSRTISFIEGAVLAIAAALLIWRLA